MVVDEAGGCHAERGEDAVVEELLVRLAGDFVDEDAEDYVVGVAVAPPIAGRPFNGQGVDLLH